MLGNCKEACGDNLTVGNNDDDVGRKLFEELLDFRRANLFRLVHGKMRGARDVLHGGSGKLVAAAARAVGLRDYPQDRELGPRQKMFERGDGELRGAAKQEAHGSGVPSRNKGFAKYRADRRSNPAERGHGMLRPYRVKFVTEVTILLVCEAF